MCLLVSWPIGDFLWRSGRKTSLSPSPSLVHSLITYDQMARRLGSECIRQRAVSLQVLFTGLTSFTFRPTGGCADIADSVVVVGRSILG